MKSPAIVACLFVLPLTGCSSEQTKEASSASSTASPSVAPSAVGPALSPPAVSVPGANPTVTPSSPSGATGAGGTGAGASGASGPAAASSGATGAGASGAGGSGPGPTSNVPGATGQNDDSSGEDARDGDAGLDAPGPTGPSGAADADVIAPSGDGGQAMDPASTSGEGIPCDRQFSIPSFDQLTDNAKMPDPFTFLDGSKVETKADWVCRQKEISLLAQAFIYGRKPPKPETLTATFSDGTLTVDMAEAGRTYSLSVGITTPNGEGPVPAVFNVDGAGGPQGMASIGTSLQWLTSNVASAPMYSRNGGGAFYEFHPEYPDTGSLMAWAWAASRIIDGLELTADQHNIDPSKTFGLGCSRNGKTSATMALFDRRMAMVAMYSPGSGTTSGWRVAETQTGDVQTAEQIYGETTWMGEPFGQFGNQVNKLPIDQHEVLALAWPRPLLVREGTQDSWNCPVCVYTTVKYTQMIFEALGSKDDVGLTHYNGGHCANGGQEWSTLFDAFVSKHIYGDDSASTAGMFTESFQFDATRWQDGELPASIE